MEARQSFPLFRWPRLPFDLNEQRGKRTCLHVQLAIVSTSWETRNVFLILIQDIIRKVSHTAFCVFSGIYFIGKHLYYLR